MDKERMMKKTGAELRKKIKALEKRTEKELEKNGLICLSDKHAGLRIFLPEGKITNGALPVECRLTFVIPDKHLKLEFLLCNCSNRSAAQCLEDYLQLCNAFLAKECDSYGSSYRADYSVKDGICVLTGYLSFAGLYRGELSGFIAGMDRIRRKHINDLTMLSDGIVPGRIKQNIKERYDRMRHEWMRTEIV